EHVTLAQGGEARAEVEVEVGALGRVDGELEHGDVGLRKRVDEEGPRAMVEAPGLIERDRARLHDLSDLFRNAGVAGRVVADVEELPRKSRKIVDGARARHRRDG